MKIHNLLLLLALVAFMSTSCDESFEGVTGGDDVKESFNRSDLTHSFEKSAQFDDANDRVHSLTYEITRQSDNRVWTSHYLISDLRKKLNDINAPNYKWKILEDVAKFEIDRFGRSSITKDEQALIDESNGSLDEADPFGPCTGLTSGAGAIAGLEYLDMRLNEDQWLFFGGIECIVDQPQFTAWIELYESEADQSLIDNLPEDTEIQRFDDLTVNSAPVNLDYFGIQICNCPGEIIPYSLYELLRSEFHLIDEPNCNSDFILYDEFSQGDWIDSPEGTLFTVDIEGDNGDVVCFEESSDDDELLEEIFNGYHWIFATVSRPRFGDRGLHPVSGNRKFGLFQSGQQCLTFYTLGVDRVRTLSRISEIPFMGADALWTCLIHEEIAAYTSNIGCQIGGPFQNVCRPQVSEWLSVWRESCYDLQLVDDLEGDCVDCN